MLEKRVLVDSEGRNGKTVLVSNRPDVFQPALNKVGWKILQMLSEREMYTAEIARQLNMHHQRVYYHIRRLESSGLIKKHESKDVRGGRAVLYRTTSDGFAVELKKESKLISLARFTMPKFTSFFKEFILENSFNGWVVVGSPLPHGRNNTQARDGHYAVQLGFAIGQYVSLPSIFPVKLDVDVKAERLEGSNMIIVGGPRTNMIAEELNKYMQFRFEHEGHWDSIVDNEGKLYSSEFDALVVKLRNPWERTKYCIVIAGLTGAGTKAAIIAITNNSERILSDYMGGEAALLLRGKDMDGDGKVDTAELIKQA